MEKNDMTSDEMKKVLLDSKNIAIVGLSPKGDRPSSVVASYLQSKGYKIIPIRPIENDILGEKAYESLLTVPHGIDIVDIFRRSEAVPGIVQEAIEKEAKVIWMQEGVVSEEGADLARRAGLKVIMDMCIKKAHQRFFGD